MVIFFSCRGGDVSDKPPLGTEIDEMQRFGTQITALAETHKYDEIKVLLDSVNNHCLKKDSGKYRLKYTLVSYEQGRKQSEATGSFFEPELKFDKDRYSLKKEDRYNIHAWSLMLIDEGRRGPDSVYMISYEYKFNSEITPKGPVPVEKPFIAPLYRGDSLVSYVYGEHYSIVFEKLVQKNERVGN